MKKILKIQVSCTFVLFNLNFNLLYFFLTFESFFFFFFFLQVNGVSYTSVNLADNGSEPAANEPSHDVNVNTSETLS